VTPLLERTKTLTVDELADMSSSLRNSITKDTSVECPIAPHIMIRDICMKSQGPREDADLANHPELQKNLRRGNTLLEIFEEEDYHKLKKRVVARKGCNKFYDLLIDYVYPDTMYEDGATPKAHENIKNYMLAAPKKALLQGYEI